MSEQQSPIEEGTFNTIPFSPLDDNVVQRDYTKPNVTLNDFSPIEEPTFAVPSFEELDNNFRTQLGEEDPSGSADPRQVWGREDQASSANPYTENLDKKEQKQASMAMVDAILDGYGQLKQFSNRLLMISPNKVKKLINEGEIDPNTMIPMPGGKMMPLMDYVEMYNSEVSETIGMSDEFREKVTPLLLRVLMKRNIGMTDEQLLAYYAVSDILTTSIQIYGIRSQNNAILDQLKEMKQAGSYAQPQSSHTTNEVRQEPKQQEPVREEPVYEAPPQSTREYSEPEEKKPSKGNDYTQYEVLDDLQPEPARVKKTRKSRVVKTTPMPEFGDAELLSHMENIASGGNPKRRKK